MKKYIFILIFTFANIIAFNQNARIKFDRISLEKGLSQSSVTSIVQDEKGFMWFATIDGLNKYDGYEMKTYYNIEQDSAISDNVLNHLFHNPYDNSLWIGTAGKGLCKYDKIKDKFIIYMHNNDDTNSLSNNTINSIIANQEILWIATDNGLNKFDTKKLKWTIYTKQSTNNGIANNKIYALCKDEQNNIWIGTEQGLNFFDTQNNSFKKYSTTEGLTSNKITALAINKNILYIATDKGLNILDIQTNKLIDYDNELKNKNITTILVDYQEMLWAGTKTSGLYKFDYLNNTLINYIHDQSDINSISINSILSLYQDKSNILWIGTSLGGINKWNRAADNLLVFRHNPYDSYSLSSNQVRCIYQDNNKDIWIGTIDGGLNQWDKETNKFNHIQHQPDNPNSLPNNHVRTIMEDSLNNFWIGTGGGITYYNRKKNSFTNYKHDTNNTLSISNDNVWKIMLDTKKQCWVATHGGGLNLFDMKNKTFKEYRHNPDDSTTISSDYITFILIDSKNTFWIGTIEGVNIFYPETGKAKRFYYQKNNPNTLSNNRIYSIVEDSKSNIWIGTKGGLNKYNHKDENFTRYTTQTHNFPNNVMMGILEDNQNNLWISTNRGISKFNTENQTVRNYDIRDGLQSNEFLASSFLKNEQGMMFFGGINGFNAFNPDNIKNNQNIPSVVITKFQVSNLFPELDSAVSEKKIIYLNHKQTDITFHFVALDYIFSEKNQYKYMLVGYDKDWVDAKFERYAKYTNLKPKKYIFKVKGSNNDEVWNETGTEIVVIIQPAFWQTLFFKILSITIIAASVLLFFLIRIRVLNRQKEKLERQVEIRTKQLQESYNEISHKNNLLQEQKESIIQQNQILQQQNEEIEAQRDEIQRQKEVAEASRDRIAEQKQEIEDSIHYAKRIQYAALPKLNFLDSILNEYFILFKPRDIVSGDFYWANKIDDKLIIVAADCTGHGVPGAFMSMLGISFLDEIVNINRTIRPDMILNQLRDSVIKALKQTGDFFEAKDGMDISISAIDYSQKKLIFAGANNPMYYIRNNEVEIYKGDGMPIAIYEQMQPFGYHEIDFITGDIFYLFSDGYADQFGGPKGKKFMYKKFRELLQEISPLKMSEQKIILDNTIEEWKLFPTKTGEKQFYQIDDIVIIGIRL